MTRLRRLADDLLWGPGSGSRLLFVHTALAALIGLRVVLGPYRPLAEVPDALFDPVPFLFWLDGMPPVGVIVALQAVGGLAAVAAVLRRRPRLAFALAWICYLVLAGLRGSRGKVLHNDLLLLWTSAPFLLAPVAVAWRDRGPRRATGWPVRVAMVIAALVYFFAGYHKLRRSGFDWAFGDNMRYLMLWGPSIGEAPWRGLAEWVADHALVAKASATFILGWELTFPLVLVYRRLRPVYAVAAALFHVGTWLTLGLDYWAWAGTVLVLFVDWPAVLDRVRARQPAIRVGPDRPG